MDIEKAIEELRESYELKHRQWAYNCLDVIKEELKKKDLIINEMAKQLVGIAIYDEEKEGSIVYSHNEKEVIEYFTKKVEGK